MAKPKTVFTCQSCGFKSPRWQGQCPECQTWHSFVEETEVQPTPGMRQQAPPVSTMRLNEIPDVENYRYPSRFAELDRVLGGGIVPGSVILLGGEPGIGKSTLLLQLLGALPQLPALYASGEESLTQIKLRANRLDLSLEHIHFANTTDTAAIVSRLKADKPKIAIIDSIQTLQSETLTGAAGSVGQIRESASALIEIAKQEEIAIVIVGHVTKSGEIAGPKVLEHMVDVVLYLEGDRLQHYRVLRANKNRFGDISEVGLFEMKTTGLQAISDPGNMFVASSEATSGAVRTITLEGSRPLLVELQALTVPSNFGYPKRTTSGLPLNRLQLLIAVLIRRASLRLHEQDVYASIVGGLSLSESALDLALCLSISSSLLDQRFPSDMIALGEISLSGALLPTPRTDLRIQEAKRLGFTRALVPQSEYDKIVRSQKGFSLIAVRSISEALAKLNWLPN